MRREGGEPQNWPAAPVIGDRRAGTPAGLAPPAAAATSAAVATRDEEPTLPIDEGSAWLGHLPDLIWRDSMRNPRVTVSVLSRCAPFGARSLLM